LLAVTLTEQAALLFDQLAPVYDGVLPFFSGFAGRHLEWLAPAPGARVLDLGAGRGALTAAALDRGCRVIAVDVAPGMAWRLAARHPDADVLVMDAHRLAFPDQSFDLVCAGFVTHLLEDPAAAAAQVRRVLAPAGTFSFSVPRGADDAPEWDFCPQQYREFTSLIPAGEGRLGRELDGRQLLAGAGFAEIEAADIQQRLPVPDADTFWNWALSHGSRAFIDALPAQARREFEARVRAGLAAMNAFILKSGATLWRGTVAATY
jgi:O-methyltransferase/aklanonic acid methyltransferase